MKFEFLVNKVRLNLYVVQPVKNGMFFKHNCNVG